MASRAVMRDLAQAIARLDEAEADLAVKADELAQAERQFQRAQNRVENRLEAYRAALAGVNAEEQTDPSVI